MLKAIKKHYHWLIAVIVFLEMIIYGGLINSASIFIQPISDTLGVPTTAYSVAMMPYTITCFIGTCFSGYLFSHFGYKDRFGIAGAHLPLLGSDRQCQQPGCLRHQ